MSAVPKRKLTVAEYLAMERRSETKSEFFDGDVFAMTGASREHNRIKENLVGELYSRLKGGECQTFSSAQRVLAEPTGLYTYPDVVVVCGPPEYDAADRDTLTNPVAVIEVLSPTTESYDRGAKFRHYQKILTLNEYILIAQDEPVCERYIRQVDSSWALVSFVGLSATLAFASIPANIPLVDLYSGVDFPEPTLR